MADQSECLCQTGCSRFRAIAWQPRDLRLSVPSEFWDEDSMVLFDLSALYSMSLPSTLDVAISTSHYPSCLSPHTQHPPQCNLRQSSQLVLGLHRLSFIPLPFSLHSWPCSLFSSDICFNTHDKVQPSLNSLFVRFLNLKLQLPLLFNPFFLHCVDSLLTSTMLFDVVIHWVRSGFIFCKFFFLLHKIVLHEIEKLQIVFAHLT